MMKSCFGGLNILMMLYPVLCIEDNSTCVIGTPQKCSHVTRSFRSSEYNVISSGSCEFDSGFCNYTQKCTGSGSRPWENVNGSAEMQGQIGLADSFSVLGSPVIYIPCNSNLIINVSIANPSQLQIALIKNNASCILMNQTNVGTEENVNESFLIEGPAYIEILFRGYNGGASSVGKISYVRLHSVQLTTARNCTDPNSQNTSWQSTSSSSESTLTANSVTDNSVTERSSKTDSQHTTWQSTSSSSESTLTANSVTDISTTENNNYSTKQIGVIVGPIMAVVAIVAVIIGVIAWKKRRSHHNRNEDNCKKHSHQQSTSVKDVRTANNQFDVINKVGLATVDVSESINISSNRNILLYTPIGFEPHDTHADRIPDGGHSEKPRFQESDHYDLIKSHADTNAFMGGNVTSNLNRMNLTKMQTGAPVYSVVQTNRHNPEIIDESSVDDYNRIDLDNHTTGKESGAAALNVYNKLKSPLYDVPPSSKIKPLKPAVDMPQDDYNKLDYKQNLRDRTADNENEAIDECDSKLNSYSSLGNSTDTYTRVQSGKKDKVIASDYDHIV